MNVGVNEDWRDGFLFLGNRLSLDFLNTCPVSEGNSLELLPDAPSLARWLKAAGLLTERASTVLQQKWSGPMPEEIRRYRERLRTAVAALERGTAPSKQFIAETNALLSAHPSTDRLVQKDSGLMLVRYFDPQTPLDALAPIVEDVAGLLTTAVKSRIRRCAGAQCVLHFYDTSRKGTRRWCSMNLCGNRSKVAAYASRKRSEN
jgi:predicted RNA-binding Zn ribbon-like protein